MFRVHENTSGQKSDTMRTILSKQQLFSLVVSVSLSVFMVTVVAYGATITISNRGVGSGTSTPGAALGVQGAAIIDDFVWANAFISTSTSQRSGIGTTSPGTEFSVHGAVLVEDFVWSSALMATSTSQHSGIGTTSPGTEFAVEGAVIVDDFVWTGALTATSTSRASGFGTSSPGADFAVAGAALFDGKLTADYFNATSTTATSTIEWSLTTATSSLQVDGVTGRVVIGATTTMPQSGVMGRTGGNPDIGLTVTGTGSGASATGTVYIAGGGASGGELIIKSGDGNNCVSMVATTGASDPDTAAQLFANLLTVRVVACPK